LNKKLSNYARNELLKGLSQCTEAQQHLFKRTYAGGKLELSIEKVVENMDDEKLDWAMVQIDNTINKNPIKEIKSKSIKAYRIRNKEGKYSPKGHVNERHFKSLGNIWLGSGTLRNHLNLYAKSNIPEDWTVEEYELVLKNTYNAKEFAKDRVKKKKKEKE
jgi:hypothetical protein